MPVTRATFLPVLVGAEDAEVSRDHVTDEFVADLRVGYLVGPPSHEHLLTWDELDAQRIATRELRRAAADSLYAALDGIGIHGQPPALMLSFDGLESSALLAHRFWDDIETAVPGELVVGVPARDVVIFTGSGSRTGMEKVRRAVDRVFFAGGRHLLSRDLFVRRERCWHRWDAPAEPPWSAPPASGPPRSAPPGSAPPGSGPPWSAPGSGAPWSAQPRSPMPAPRSPMPAPRSPAPARPEPVAAPARRSAPVPAGAAPAPVPGTRAPARSAPVPAPAPARAAAPRPAPPAVEPAPAVYGQGSYGHGAQDPLQPGPRYRHSAGPPGPGRIPRPRTPRSSARAR